MSLDTTQVIGYAIEATAETDPVTTTSSLYWKFGIHAAKVTFDHPVEDHHWEHRYVAGQRNPSDTVLVESLLSKSIVYYPVNTVGHYLALGACTTTTGTHAINNLNSGSLPTFTVRSEGRGGTASRYISGVGCKVHTISGYLDLISGWPYLSEKIGYTGIKSQQATLNETHTTGTKYPTDDGTMTGTQTTERFKWDQNASFHWDSNADGAGDTDYTSALELFEYSIGNSFDLGFVENQSELEYIDEGNYTISFNFTLKRGTSDNIFTDYKNKGKAHDMYLHIHAGASNYQTLSFVNCSLGVCKPPFTLGNNTPTWLVQGQAEDFAVASVDGISTSVFYGE